MSETTTTTPAPVDVAVPANENGVKIADMGARAVELLKAGNTLPHDKRAELDARAFTAVAKHVANKWGERDVIHHVETLPAYGMSGVGSLRYTKQRAALMIGIASATGCVAELAYRKYTYPNPSTGRRNYFVNVWGADVDVERARALFGVLETRIVKDGYNNAILPMPADAKPAEQTKIRREFFARFADEIASTLSGVVDTVAAERKAEGAISDRQSKAEKAQSEHHETVAAQGDAEVTESATE